MRTIAYGGFFFEARSAKTSSLSFLMLLGDAQRRANGLPRATARGNRTRKRRALVGRPVQRTVVRGGRPRESKKTSDTGCSSRLLARACGPRAASRSREPIRPHYAKRITRVQLAACEPRALRWGAWRKRMPLLRAPVACRQRPGQHDRLPLNGRMGTLQAITWLTHNAQVERRARPEDHCGATAASRASARMQG
jgi:hypothetical protein